jgi:hypothetical protein
LLFVEEEALSILCPPARKGVALLALNIAVPDAAG